MHRRGTLLDRKPVTMLSEVSDAVSHVEPNVVAAATHQFAKHVVPSNGPFRVIIAMKEIIGHSHVVGLVAIIQRFDCSRSATRRAISAGASSGIGNTELTLISPST